MEGSDRHRADQPGEHNVVSSRPNDRFEQCVAIIELQSRRSEPVQVHIHSDCVGRSGQHDAEEVFISIRREHAGGGHTDARAEVAEPWLSHVNVVSRGSFVFDPIQSNAGERSVFGNSRFEGLVEIGTGSGIEGTEVVLGSANRLTGSDAGQKKEGQGYGF